MDVMKSVGVGVAAFSYSYLEMSKPVRFSRFWLYLGGWTDWMSEFFRWAAIPGNRLFLVPFVQMRRLRARWQLLTPYERLMCAGFRGFTGFLGSFIEEVIKIVPEAEQGKEKDLRDLSDRIKDEIQKNVSV